LKNVVWEFGIIEFMRGRGGGGGFGAVVLAGDTLT